MSKSRVKRKLKHESKPMIIILEGPDGVGKNVVENEILNLSNFKHSVINRFLGSSYAYSKYYRRKNYEWMCLEYIKMDTMLSKLHNRFYMAFLTASVNELKRRIKGRDDYHMCDKWNDIFPYFMEYLDRSKIRWNWIDTTKGNPKQIAQLIINLAEGK